MRDEIIEKIRAIQDELVFRPLSDRYEMCERSIELYEAMISVE